MFTPLFTPLASKTFQATRSLVLAALMCAMMTTGKQMMSGLPNIEPVSLLILLFTLEFPRETPLAITGFILLQGMMYGFGIWWFMYVYIWFLLALLVWLFRRIDHPLFWAVLNGLYGLAFGGLCALVYLPIWDISAVVTWWLAGLRYDVSHMVGNFSLTLLLYWPLRKAIQIAKKQTHWE